MGHLFKGIVFGASERVLSFRRIEPILYQWPRHKKLVQDLTATLIQNSNKINKEAVSQLLVELTSDVAS